MNRWITRILAAAALLGLVAGTFAPAFSDHHEEDMAAPAAPRKVLYLFSVDYPPDAFAQNPSPAFHETRFWHLLDKEFQKTDDLALTQNLEAADYRVELRCAGIRNCSKLIVDIKNLQRDVLATFTMKGVRPLVGRRSDVEKVASQLTTKLDQRLSQLEAGTYGYMDERFKY